MVSNCRLSFNCLVPFAVSDNRIRVLVPSRDLEHHKTMIQYYRNQYNLHNPKVKQHFYFTGGNSSGFASPYAGTSFTDAV